MLSGVGELVEDGKGERDLRSSSSKSFEQKASAFHQDVKRRTRMIQLVYLCSSEGELISHCQLERSRRIRLAMVYSGFQLHLTTRMVPFHFSFKAFKVYQAIFWKYDGGNTQADITGRDLVRS